MQPVSVKTYRFPLAADTGGQSGGSWDTARFQKWIAFLWKAIESWAKGPWDLDSWVSVRALVIGVGYQIGIVAWLSTVRPRGPKDVHGVYSFLAWMLMALVLAVQVGMYLYLVEPFFAKYLNIRYSRIPIKGRKPLHFVLLAMCTTAILLCGVLPSVDGNYDRHAAGTPGYVAVENAFVLGWMVGLLYTITLATGMEEYNLAHIGIVPAVTGTIFGLTGLAGAALVGNWMQRCYTGGSGAGPWDGCDGSTTATYVSMATPSTYSYDGSTSGGTPGCPCPNAAATRCDCPFDNNCNIQSACWNPSGGHIPSGCKMGCFG